MSYVYQMKSLNWKVEEGSDYYVQAAEPDYKVIRTPEGFIAYDGYKSLCLGSEAECKDACQQHHERNLRKYLKRDGEVKQMISVEDTKIVVVLLKEGMQAHSDPENPDYNECDTEPCQWCEEASKVVKGLEACLEGSTCEDNEEAARRSS